LKALPREGNPEDSLKISSKKKNKSFQIIEKFFERFSN
jgi:hypothetical protein